MVLRKRVHSAVEHVAQLWSENPEHGWFLQSLALTALGGQTVEDCRQLRHQARVHPAGPLSL